ncbi:hypothetical protein [Rhizobium sp. RM]|uniref:hypothetical protein n=1 Tax=Rhizobium sp. RM TaxID=2748079 RepID=UPI00110DAF22|nr:hypothetical protein [Rhizobium sp. RM]NWJ25602.1 hypothetical protein [Rhizobium sp. RM]TMV18586.1 hypothetical protein BJG94_15235 [Rhizobium sp. Td3]
MAKSTIQAAYEYEQGQEEVRVSVAMLPGIIKALALLFAVTFIGICLDVAVVTVQGWYHAFMAYWPF